MAGGSDGRKVFPVWPEQELARLWVGGDWADCRPASIELSDYLGRWVPGMDRDGHDVSVFPTKGKHSVVMGAIRWGELLEAECGRFPEYSWG